MPQKHLSGQLSSWSFPNCIIDGMCVCLSLFSFLFYIFKCWFLFTLWSIRKSVHGWPGQVNSKWNWPRPGLVFFYLTASSTLVYPSRGQRLWSATAICISFCGLVTTIIRQYSLINFPYTACLATPFGCLIHYRSKAKCLNIFICVLLQGEFINLTWR